MRFILFTALSYLSYDICSKFFSYKNVSKRFSVSSSTPKFPHTQEQQSLVSDTMFVLQVVDDVSNKYKPR